tara:strand:- start:1009 stop:1929 length:921 start_codon:yes stop_codon:yes gene_type:complete
MEDPTEVTTTATDYDYSDPAIPDAEPVSETSTEEIAEDTSVDSSENIPDESPQAPTVEPPVEFPPELLEKAGELGFRYEDIKALGTPEAVRVAIDRETQANDPAETTEESASELEGLKGLADKGFDEELINQLVDTFGSLSQKNSQLEQQMQQMQQSHETSLGAVQQQAATADAARLVNWFDEQFGNLPDNVQEFVGTGKSADITQTSKEFQTRETIAQRYVKMQSDWQGWGFSGPNDQQIFDKAVQMTVGDNVKTQTRNDIKSQMRNTGSQVTARPTHTQRAASDPREAAAEFAKSHSLWSHTKE